MMFRFPEFSRDLHRGEEGAVGDLLNRAYGGGAEAKTVDGLRRAGVIAGEVVLPCQGGIVGYYALSRMRAPGGALCVGPVAIDPDWQRAGHGRRMIGLLAEWARLSGTCVLAEGCEAFFARAGFRASGVDGLWLAGPARDLSGVELLFPKAFDRT
ncbi:GNAT family N-acetyltransferase [Roseovarius dicentrarchi]|uniref:GNAT family N-acetyltransferase n=1 Tax=Roseovarius dicentrarchi TaxID=2250573 RepID=UPI001EF0D3ED|nr:GNAT family N-acetyltransferase [Roseovarius dicentrarchi]